MPKHTLITEDAYPHLPAQGLRNIRRLVYHELGRRPDDPFLKDLFHKIALEIYRENGNRFLTTEDAISTPLNPRSRKHSWNGRK